jgi:hypothetical protein
MLQIIHVNYANYNVRVALIILQQLVIHVLVIIIQITIYNMVPLYALLYVHMVNILIYHSMHACFVI